MAWTVICKAARNADDNRVFRISGLFSGVCGAGMVAGCAEPHAGADRLASLFQELSVGTSHAVCRRDHDTGQCDRSSFIYGCFGKSICEYGSAGKQQCVLFASVCVYACHKGAGGLFYAGLIAVWACVCVIARLAGTGVQMFLFTSVPLAVHGAVTAASFCLLFVSIGKVEKKMLTLSHVSKSYGKFPAVEDISLEMEHGLYGMLAPNGAGKTTLIKMIATLLVPTQGEILWDGIPVAKLGENTGICWGICRSSLDITKQHTRAVSGLSGST